MPSKNHMKTKKSKQVSFKVEATIGQSIEAASKSEELPTADFVRKIFLWGLEQYEAAGWLRTLRLVSLPNELIEKALAKEREARRQHRARLKQKKS